MLGGLGFIVTSVIVTLLTAVDVTLVILDLINVVAAVTLVIRRGMSVVASENRKKTIIVYIAYNY